MNKNLLIIAQEKYCDIAKEIVNDLQDFVKIECWNDVQKSQVVGLTQFDNILLAGSSKKLDEWRNLLQVVERKLLFLSLTTISGMAYKVKMEPKVPDDYKFDEVM